MGFQYDWCEEIIAQFSATVYFQSNEDNTMHWMTRGRWYNINYKDFVVLLAFENYNMHEKTRDGLMSRMYIPGGQPVLGTVKGLKSKYIYLNRMLRKTLTPKDGDASHINSLSNNILRKMMNIDTFDVPRFIWDEIYNTSVSHRKGLGYSPQIMFLIEIVIRIEFVKKVKHTRLGLRLD
uniref:Uncharacterized protein n=1 Tax=Oryza brachyantha TaxID=4533 RepID=J3LNS7_ORYBR